MTLLTATYTWVFVILSISFRFLTNYNSLCNDNSMIFLLQSLNNRLIFDSNEYLALDSSEILLLLLYSGITTTRGKYFNHHMPAYMYLVSVKFRGNIANLHASYPGSIEF